MGDTSRAATGAKPKPVLELVDAAIARPQDPESALMSDVQFRVDAGDFSVVAGLQGSGKTILLEAAAGLQPLLHGHLRLFGEPVTRVEGDAFRAIRRRIGVVFEGSGRLFQRLTVEENVSLPLRYHQDVEVEDVAAQIAEVMEVCGIGHLVGISASRLAKGWQLRVALARALSLKPELLLLDNPLAGLDSVHTLWWRTFLLDLVRGHPYFGGVPRSLVVMCDDLRPWVRLGKRFSLVSEGRWRTLGDQASVLADADPIVRALLTEGF